MIFCLFNTLTSFYKYINKILAKKFIIFIIVYLDNLFIYTKDPGQLHVDVIYWVLEQLWKNNFFANLKKSHFH